MPEITENKDQATFAKALARYCELCAHSLSTGIARVTKDRHSESLGPETIPICICEFLLLIMKVTNNFTESLELSTHQSADQLKIIRQLLQLLPQVEKTIETCQTIPKEIATAIQEYIAHLKKLATDGIGIIATKEDPASTAILVIIATIANQLKKRPFSSSFAKN
ncbi:MAG: hypothetical protein WC873_03410 [Candidatus Gracilibacteria bacterium]